MKKVNIESKNVLARLMATENLTVQHKKVSTASFDVKNRVLNLPIWEDMSNVLYEGLIGHEVGHALYTPYEEWKEFITEYAKLRDYANVIEDARIERLMKIKYPGMNKTFFGMYDELNMKDFFGLNGREVNTYGILDRINLHFKLGVRADVKFTDEEMVFVNRANETVTFKDVLDLTRDLGEYAENEVLNTEFDDMSEEYEYVSGPMDSDDEYEVGTSTEGGTVPSSDSLEGSKDSSEEGDADGEDGTGDSNIQNDEEGTGDSTKNDAGAGGEDESPLESETQKNFDDNMGNLNDHDASNPIYVDLPNVDVKNSIFGHKEVNKFLKKHYDDATNYSYWDESSTENKDKIDKEIRVWKKDTLPVVNYMVKEFEMKQAASAHRRTSVGKTGVLDTNKMHAYRYEEDIFKRVATVRDGRNHALSMYVDWSGSMHDKIHATVKQTITLVMFARKVGIPFRVYSFANSSPLFRDHDDAENEMGRSEKFYETESNNNFSFNHLKLGRVRLVEFFNEKMSAREFNDAIDNFYRLSMSVGHSQTNTYVSAPYGFSLASTPLNEAIIASYSMVEDFKRETGKEKVNVIWLTDGDSDGNNEYYDVEETRVKYGAVSWGEKSHLAIRDPKTRKVISNNPAGNWDQRALTSDLLAGLGERCGVNVIGFFLTDARTIKYAIDRNMKWEEGDKVKKTLTKKGYVSMKSGGYDKYFMINDKKMDNEVEFAEVDKKDDGSVNKVKLRTAFKKFSKGRKVNKMLLNEFISIVA
jgi:hypothetical protein